MAVSTNTCGGFLRLSRAALTMPGMCSIRAAAARTALVFSTVDWVRMRKTLSAMYSL